MEDSAFFFGYVTGIFGTLASFPYVPYVFRPKKAVLPRPPVPTALDTIIATVIGTAWILSVNEEPGCQRVCFFAVVRDLYI